MQINKVAIIGAGTIGTEVAYLCSKAKMETYLFDISAEGPDPLIFVKQSIKDLINVYKNTEDCECIQDIKIAAYPSHLHYLEQCDLVIDVTTEKYSWKKFLYQQIQEYLNPNVIIICHNGSIAIQELIDLLPEHRQRFAGAQFFYPPRKMPLVTMVSNIYLQETVLYTIYNFFQQKLNKFVVLLRDSPVSIGYRFSGILLVSIEYHRKRLNLPLDIIDVLTGPLIGRPFFATLRTIDYLGVDRVARIIEKVAQHSGCLWKGVFVVPSWLSQLRLKGFLGFQTGSGIYKKMDKYQYIWCPKLADYRPCCEQKVLPKELVNFLSHEHTSCALQNLKESSLVEAQFVYSVILDLWHYSSYHAKYLVYKMNDFDSVLRWGFSFQWSPFAAWEELGWDVGIDWLKDAKLKQTLLCSAAPLPVLAEQEECVY